MPLQLFGRIIAARVPYVSSMRVIIRMKLQLATIIAASFSTLLFAQSSVQLTAPQQPTVELSVDTLVPGSANGLSSSGRCDLVPLQREFPGFGGQVLNDSAVDKVYFMTTLNPTGSGSISAAPSGAYVVPLVAGKILSDTSLVLSQDNIRFLGSLAPGHLSINGSTVFNSSQLVRFDGSNALWEHFSLRASDVPGNAGQSSHKPFTVENGNSGVVLGNLSVHYGDDDSGSVWNTTSDVTLYRLLAAHAVDRLAAGGNLNYGLFVGGGASNVTLFQNVMMTGGRSPHIQNADNTQSVNNIVYHATTDGTSNQIFAVHAPPRTVHVNFHDNLEIRFDTSAANIWRGESSPTLLELYAGNNRYRDCANNYADMGFHSSIPDLGTVVPSPHSMPALPVITDLTALEDFLLPRVGNFVNRDALDDDVMSYISSCTMPSVFDTASDYFSDPWPAGPTRPLLTFWDESSVDGLSDAAKEACGIPPGTNLLSPNDGRWEAVVDFHSGGRLSASMQ